MKSASVGRVPHPDDLSRIIGELDRRIKALENHNPIPNTPVIRSLGSTGQSGSQAVSTGGSGSFVLLAGTPLTVTLTDPTTSILIFFIYTAQVTAGTQLGYIRVNGGAAGSTGGANVSNTNGPLTLMEYFFIPSLPAGTYTFQLEAATDSLATTMTSYGSNLTALAIAA